MADMSSNYDNVTVVRRPNWGAIWAGVFAFLAIWSVFGALGVSIFGTFAATAAPAGGVGVGMSIWAVILTIIAMFVGGRVTGGLAGTTDTRGGSVHGLVMFGLAIAASVVIVAAGGATLAGIGLAAMHRVYLLDIFSYPGWPLFVALFLGWLAAMGGAATAHKELPVAIPMQQQVHHA